MTGVGHALVGVAVGLLCVPAHWSRRKRLLAYVCLAALGNVPDLPLPGWGHHRYDISHSVFSNLVLAAVGVGLLGAWRSVRLWLGGYRVLHGGGVALLSHLLLDSLYNHGQGIAVLWPLSQGRLCLPLPWFSILPRGWVLEMHTLQVVAIELAFYGAVVAFCAAIRRRWFHAPAARS